MISYLPRVQKPLKFPNDFITLQSDFIIVIYFLIH